jgi:hypothetical protein
VLKSRLLKSIYLLVFFSAQSVLAVDNIEVPAAKYNLGTTYTIAKLKNIKLRVTSIPTEFSWINRDLEGKVIVPEEGSVIVFENLEPIKMSDLDGESSQFPEGTKFYARLSSKTEAKKFHRKGKAKLMFFQIKVPGMEKEIKLDGTEFSSQDSTNVIGDGLKAIGKVGAYSLGGALAAPLMTFAIAGSGVLGLGLLSNPYVLLGSSAVGGAAGFVYGLQKKGDDFILEPGTEIKLDLGEPWKLAGSMTHDQQALVAKQNQINDKFKLDILKIKKTRDIFDDKCIKVSVSYENNTGEDLHYTNFLLVDSMGKEFYPSIPRLDDYSSDGLPRKANIDLYFASDFINAIHKLEVRRLHDQKLLAEHRIVLK